MNTTALKTTVWLGRVALALLLFIVTLETGASALLWLLPTVLTICFGCYAERDLHQRGELDRITARLEALLKRMDAAKRR